MSAVEDESRQTEGEVIEPQGETTAQPEQLGEPQQEEIVEGLPVLAEVRPVQPSPPTAFPAVQAAAAAATGFVAGAATVAFVRHRAARRLARSQGLDLRRPGPAFPSAGAGRTFLVHVRVLGREGG